MSKAQNIFKRYELKYILTKEQYQDLRKVLDEYMEPDKYGKTTIASLYYDTPEKLLIRRSMEHPDYKEKLRVRSYGIAWDDSKVYIELKKKYDGVVYKRRVSMKCREALEYLGGEKRSPKDTQIVNEIDYFLKFYKTIEPSMILYYDRMAFCGKEDKNLRITFDKNIRYRDTELSLKSPVYGTLVLPEDKYLLEIKVMGGMPPWLVRSMNKLKIYKTSFSKYAVAYKMSLAKNGERNKRCV